MTLEQDLHIELQARGLAKAFDAMSDVDFVEWYEATEQTHNKARYIEPSTKLCVRVQELVGKERFATKLTDGFVRLYC